MQRVEGLKLFVLAWNIVAMFLVYAFNCNLRSALIQYDFQKPVGKLFLYTPNITLFLLPCNQLIFKIFEEKN